jgi:hypothetical protein
VSVDWKRAEGAFDLEVTIPAGMEAEIVIPKLGATDPEIHEGDRTVWRSAGYLAGTPGLTGARADAESVRIQAGSGRYHFTLK